MFSAEGGNPTSPYNFGKVDDPIAFQTSLQITCELDDDTYFAMIKEDDVRRLGMMYQIILPTPTYYTLWWPWLKNYHGEQWLGWAAHSLSPVEYVGGEIYKYLWIDQDLKDEMGY